MILHINGNYIYSLLHATMMDHMPHPEEHIVFSPVVYHPQQTVWEKESVPSEPKVYVAPCFAKWERLFCTHRRNKMYAALKKTIPLDTVDLAHAYTPFADGDLAYRLYRERGALPFEIATSMYFLNISRCSSGTGYVYWKKRQRFSFYRTPIVTLSIIRWFRKRNERRFGRKVISHRMGSTISGIKILRCQRLTMNGENTEKTRRGCSS